MLDQYFESVILKRLCVLMAAYFATHGFHHWGIDITVSIQSDALKESILAGTVILHGYICKKYPDTWGKWI